MSSSSPSSTWKQSACRRCTCPSAPSYSARPGTPGRPIRVSRSFTRASLCFFVRRSPSPVPVAERRTVFEARSAPNWPYPLAAASDLAARPDPRRVEVEVARSVAPGFRNPWRSSAALRHTNLQGRTVSARAGSRAHPRGRRRRPCAPRACAARAGLAGGGVTRASRSAAADLLVTSATTALLGGSSRQPAGSRSGSPRRGSPARRQHLQRHAATSSTVSASMPPIANQGTRSRSRAARTSRPPGCGLRLRRRAEDRADAEVVRVALAVRRRWSRRGPRSARRRRASRVGKRHVVLADVDAVGVAALDEIGPVVQHEERAVATQTRRNGSAARTRSSSGSSLSRSCTTSTPPRSAASSRAEGSSPCGRASRTR